MVTYYKSVSLNTNTLFRVISLFKDDSLHLTVLENENAWGVNVMKSNLKVYAELQNLDFETYYRNLEKYLQPLPVNEEIVFVNGAFSIFLTLKNKMKIQIFKTTMIKLNFTETVYHKLDEFNANIATHISELSTVKKKYSLLQQDYEALQKQMNKFLDRRKDDELNLYNKFVQILNEKKFQIQHLNELLISFRTGRPTVNPPPPTKQKKGCKTVPNIQVQDEKQSESSDSEEDLHSQKQFAKNTQNSPQPSTSKIEMDFPESPQSPSPSFSKRTGNMEADNWIAPSESEDEAERKVPSTNGNNGKNVLTVNFNTQDLLDDL